MQRFYTSRRPLRKPAHFSFDSLLDTLERRVFRIAMLIVLLLWLGEKIRDTAVATHFAAFDSKPGKNFSADLGSVRDFRDIPKIQAPSPVNAELLLGRFLGRSAMTQRRLKHTGNPGRLTQFS